MYFSYFSFLDFILGFQIPIWVKGHRGRDRMEIGFTTTCAISATLSSSLKLWVWIMLMRVVLDTTLCDEICLWLVASQWFTLSVFDLQLPVQSVPITTKVLSLNPVHGDVYSIQLNVIKVGQWFFPGTPVSPTNKTDCHDII